MSNLERVVVEEVLGAGAEGAGAGSQGAVREVLEGRDVVLGGTRGMAVVRTLPNAVRRMVGAWCFVDHFGGGAEQRKLGGPAKPRMVVPPHPHTGLQTVTWLLEGQVRHQDSLGSDQLIRPGQLNLMTAAHGIAHSEDSAVTPSFATGARSSRSPADDDQHLHGVQLWVALPEGDRDGRPGFEHHADLPRVRVGGAEVTVLMGAFGAAVSPATAYTPIMGAEVVLDGPAELPLDPAYEHAAMTLTGRPRVDGVELAPGSLLYLGGGRSSLAVNSQARDADGAGAGDRVLLLGGEPFTEEIIMWWNFIGRSHAEIVEMREQWMAGDGRFPPVGTRTPLPAPNLPTTRLKPRGRAR